MTLANVLTHLHAQMESDIVNDDRKNLDGIATTFVELRECAEAYKDIEVWHLLDDMVYIASEILMGAGGKVDSLRTEVEKSIRKLSRRSSP